VQQLAQFDPIEIEIAIGRQNICFNSKSNWGQGKRNNSWICGIWQVSPGRLDIAI